MGFGALLRSEWTKLRTVPAWVVTLFAGVVLTVVAALLVAAGAGSERTGGPAPAVSDMGRFAHRTLAGDGSVVAHVVAQDDSHPWAKAGLMIRATPRRGSPYAAIMVTPDHGVRMQSDFTTDVAGSPSAAPRWLKLTRAGSSITGYESPDGAAWTRVGTVRLDDLPHDVAAGAFVASPDAVRVVRQFGSETIDAASTLGRAAFDGVRVGPAPWGHVALTGSGDVGRNEFADDVTATTLSGVLLGVMAIVALSVLFVASEYARGTIRTTFAATPRRGRVLAAKAMVIGATTFAAGLVASAGAFLLARPLLDSAPPLDGPALRAIAGTAALLAIVALLSLGVATILRRGAAAIAVVLVALLVPQIVATGLPVSAAMWLERLTPAAGFAIQQTVHRYDTPLGPWAGLAVLSGYAALALAVATWRLDRRDA
jgi:ABC-type transport system involved in multi-copper enzyme maturation permease subunit